MMSMVRGKLARMRGRRFFVDDGMFGRGVGVGRRRHLPCGQPPFGKFPNQRVDDREGGNADNHADRAEEGAEDGDREHHPEGGKSGRVSEDLGADDVAVDLLENDDKDGEHDRRARIEDQQQKNRRDRTDKRPEVGDDVGNADDDADQHRIGPLEDRHDEKAENADNGGIDDLSDDEAAENIVTGVGDVQQLVHQLFRKDRVAQLFHMRVEKFLAREKIDRNDKAD